MKSSITLLLLLAAPFSLLAQTRFSHTDSTIASPEQIWKYWTSVEKWHLWDTGLKQATLQDSFQLGAKGFLLPDKGPKSKFRISALQNGQAYTFKTRIPLGWLVIKRALEQRNGMTYFTHTVQFTGPLRHLFAKTLGKRYQTLLPQAMHNLKTLAESNPQ